VTLNPARLAYFTDWAKTLPPRPLPRTVTPVPGEYHLDYIRRLADANHLEFLELSNALDDTAAITLHGPRGWKRHEQERLAAAAGQPLARIARLWWPDPRVYLRDPEGFRRMLRPACRRCTARRGIPGPVACHLPPHLTVCRRHRLWIGPSARAHAGQLDVSPFPEVLRAQRRHLAQLRDHPWQLVDIAVATPPAPSTRPCAPAPGSRASNTGCAGSPPAPGIRPWPACSPSAPAGQTTAPATPSSRSRSTPTSSGSPHIASGRRDANDLVRD
jgi:hypothetical protein